MIFFKKYIFKNQLFWLLGYWGQLNQLIRTTPSLSILYPRLFGYLVHFDLAHPSTLQEFSPSQVIWLFGYSVNFSPCSPSLQFRKTSPSQVIRLFGYSVNFGPCSPSLQLHKTSPSQVIWLFGYSVNFGPCSPSLQLHPKLFGYSVIQ